MYLKLRLKKVLASILTNYASLERLCTVKVPVVVHVHSHWPFRAEIYLLDVCQAFVT